MKHAIADGYTQIIVGLSRAPGAVSLEEVNARCETIPGAGVVVTVEQHGDALTPRTGETDRGSA